MSLLPTPCSEDSEWNLTPKVLVLLPFSVLFGWRKLIEDVVLVESDREGRRAVEELILYIVPRETGKIFYKVLEFGTGLVCSVKGLVYLSVGVVLGLSFPHPPCVILLISMGNTLTWPEGGPDEKVFKTTNGERTFCKKKGWLCHLSRKPCQTKRKEVHC